MATCRGPDWLLNTGVYEHAARRMTSQNRVSQVREYASTGQQRQYAIDYLIGAERAVAIGIAVDAPSLARPVNLVRCELIVTPVAAIRREMGRDDYSVIQRR